MPTAPRNARSTFSSTYCFVTVPAGAFEVKMNQPLARLAFYLLAPTSDDGVVNWNVIDDLLGEGVKTYPILRKK